MDVSAHIPVLEAAKRPELLTVSLAAVEFTLASAITLRDASDIKSVKHWSELLEPFQHQVQNLITFCRLGPVQLIADDVGMGKTVSAGLIISELMVRKKIKKVLVLAPKILLAQWKDELWTKFRIQAEHGTGNDLSRLLSGSSKVVITTYASALHRMNQIARADFDMLILDEAHKLRNLHGSPKPPKIATELKRLTAAGTFRFTLLLTATPVQNRLYDLYSLIDILAGARNHENPLGTPGEFADRYLLSKTKAWSIKPTEVAHFRRVIGEYLVRTTRRGSGLSFPERHVQTWRATPTAVEARLEAIVREHLPRLNRLQQISLAIALMSSPAAFRDQVCKPDNKTKLDADALAEVHHIADSSPLGCKAKRLFELVDQLKAANPDNWRVLIFTGRKATQREIGRALQARGARVGYIGGDLGAKQDTHIRQFQANPPEINVIVSTDTGAEGVNLQAANVVINYDLPWNPMTLEQRIGRVQRLGSLHSHVVVANLAVEGSVEELVVVRLMERLQLISHAIGDIEGILGVLDEGEDLQSQIEDLVLLALSGQDVEESRRRIEESIEKAKHLYDESLSLVNESLGTESLDAQHRSGPRAPDIEPVTPRMSLHDLVRAHFEDLGEVTELDDGRLMVRQAGQGTHYVTFDEDDPILQNPTARLGRSPTRLYAEGEGPFERLVGMRSAQRLHWVEVQELDGHEVEAFTRRWVDQLSPSVTWVRTKAVSGRQRFSGTLTALATSVNALDRLERLIEVTSPDGGWLGEDEPYDGLKLARTRGNVKLTKDSYPLAAVAALESAVQVDPAIAAFNEFYLARRKEEEAKVALQSSAQSRVHERFTPATTAELVSATGTLEVLQTIEVGYSYQPGWVATAMLTLDGSGRILAEPSLRRCELTGGYFPGNDLAECAVTGKWALRHLMLASSLSGVLMLPEAAVYCAVSGDALLPSEAVTSEFSSRRLAPRNAVTCQASGKLAAIDEVAVCDFTRSTVHSSFVAVSEVSGRPYRIDQQDCSALSGATGHASEFVKCALTNESLLPDEVAPSAASGRLIRRDLLMPSAKDPARLAAESEMVRCAVTGALLLPDEVGVSAVSGLVVDSDLLAASTWSGKLGLADELETCAVSGERILITEAIKSDFSGRPLSPAHAVTCAVTGRTAASDEIATCEFTGVKVHATQIVTSEVSGRLYRADQRVVSAVSGLSGHVSEFVTCAITGDRVLPNEAATSSVSHKLVRIDKLFPSSKSPTRRAAREEMVRCAVSGNWLMPDEVGTSAVSGLVVDLDLLTPSALTGSLALADELFTCEESGTRVLPSETGTCDSTGKRVRVDLLGTSEISGKTVLTRLLRVCPETGLRGTESEFATCEETGLLVAPEALTTCTMTGKRVIRRLLAECAKCGGLLLRSQAVETALGSHAHPHHTEISQFTGQRYLSESLARCAATGILVESQFLTGRVSTPIMELVERARGAKPSTSSLVERVSGALRRLEPPVAADTIRVAETPRENLVAVLTERKRFLRRPELTTFYLDLESRGIKGRLANVEWKATGPVFDQQKRG